MASTRSKVIDTLWRRQKLEAELFGLQNVREEAELQERVGQIAQAGHDVVPIILQNLDTANSRFLGILGAVCGALVHSGSSAGQIIEPALQHIAAGKNVSAQKRTAAALILERFMREDTDYSPKGQVYDRAEQHDGVPALSWAEILRESKKTRLVIVDYLQTLDEQPVHVLLDLVEGLRRVPSEHAVEPLRLLAQDWRPGVSCAALRALGQVRLPQAARALQTLANSLPGERQDWAERSLRKLRLCGVDIAPLAQVGRQWRCLASPPDGQGNQSIWFIQDAPIQSLCTFLHFLLNDEVGMAEVIGDDRAMTHYFPARKRLGALHTNPTDEPTQDTILLEADFDYGRRLVRAALSLPGAFDHPMPPVYRLFSDVLWGLDGARVNAVPYLPYVEQSTAHILMAQIGDLFEHPAFVAWHWPNHNSGPQVVFRRYGHPYRGRARPSAIPWSDNCRTRYAEQLRKMSEWLMFFDDRWAAQVALAAALMVENATASVDALALPLGDHVSQGAI